MSALDLKGGHFETGLARQKRSANKEQPAPFQNETRERLRLERMARAVAFDTPEKAAARILGVLMGLTIPNSSELLALAQLMRGQ
jgi:hypothetical protein